MKTETKPAPPRCVRFGCNKAILIYLKVGESTQTGNGFLIAKVAGYYCPVCMGGYGKHD